MAETGRALVVYESMYGNTERIARAIRDGLRERLPADIVPAHRSPTVVPAEVRLLVVGGPTHAFSMSRVSTREAARKQDDVVMPVEYGIREWLADFTTDFGSSTGHRALPLEVATFDTRIASVRRLPGSAARSAAKVLRRNGYHPLTSASFFVTETTGPINSTEVERAQRWGQELGEQVTDRQSPFRVRR